MSRKARRPMEAEAKIEWLRSLALFQQLPEARFAELTRFLGVERVPAGSVVIEEGSAGDAMYLVAEGQVRVEKAAAGEVKELALLSEGEIFGETALIEEAPRWVRAVAVIDTTLFVLRRDDLREWLKSDPLMAARFFVELLRVLSHHLRRAAEDLVLLHELSHLVVRKVEDETALLREALALLLPHLGEGWRGGAYLCSEYNPEAIRAAAAGPGAEALPETLPPSEPASRWLDENTYRAALAGRNEQPLGYLVIRSLSAPATREKAEIEVSLATIAALLASALHNIRHEEEERLRARLERMTTV